jgi:hypothetical protein
MATHKIKITRYINTVEEAIVTVEAGSEEEAIEIADARYCEGDYDGAPDVEWEEDADAYDAYDHELEIVKED